MSGPAKWSPSRYSWFQVHSHLLSIIPAASDLKAFFLQNIKNETTTNFSVTLPASQGNFQTPYSVLSKMGLLQIFFKNLFNYSFNHSAFSCTYSVWQRNAPCCHRKTFLDLYTVFCISQLAAQRFPIIGFCSSSPSMNMFYLLSVEYYPFLKAKLNPHIFPNYKACAMRLNSMYSVTVFAFTFNSRLSVFCFSCHLTNLYRLISDNCLLHKPISLFHSSFLPSFFKLNLS